MVKNELQERIESLTSQGSDSLSKEEALSLFTTLRQELNAGTVRAAEPDGSGGWKTNRWVKEGILLGFRFGVLGPVSSGDAPFYDKDTLPLRHLQPTDNVRLVPGGSAIRDGAYVAPGVICMPPMYINIGAYVDSGSMVDSHALVGTCAQIGKNVHVSAAAQIGGVLEPVGANPVIIEDDVMVGGNCGLYEGTIVRRRAVLASGVILTASSRLYDTVNETIIVAEPGRSLIVPEGAVIVMGSRRVRGKFAEMEGLSISTPLIVKYRDERTDAKTALEESLR